MRGLQRASLLRTGLMQVFGPDVKGRHGLPSILSRPNFPAVASIFTQNPMHLTFGHGYRAGKDVVAVLEAAARGELQDLSRLSVASMRGLLRMLGQKTSGNKPQLVQRMSQIPGPALREACSQMAEAGIRVEKREPSATPWLARGC